MAFKILNKQMLSESVKRLDILAPQIAKTVQPGQFVSVCAEEGYERISLAVIDFDLKKLTISLIFQEVDQATRKLGAMSIGEEIFSILGPLGVPAKIKEGKTVICIATGIGVAQILPICRAFKKKGNKVIGIIGAKTKKFLMLEAQMRLACHKIFIATNDGSYERRGLATDILKEIVHRFDREAEGVFPLLVYAIGSVEMMKKVCAFTKENKISTRVHLNPVMVDCIGMCGSCRVRVGGKTVLTCIDGPEFNGHTVDFNDLSIRMKAFKELKKCHNQKSVFSQEKNESGTLMKFLSGILKK